jgi:hypothetical protein
MSFCRHNLPSLGSFSVSIWIHAGAPIGEESAPLLKLHKFCWKVYIFLTCWPYFVDWPLSKWSSFFFILCHKHFVFLAVLQRCSCPQSTCTLATPWFQLQAPGGAFFAIHANRRLVVRGQSGGCTKGTKMKVQWFT